MKAMSRRGFTIVELLIVIVVIAILAAITIVAYNGINDRAQVSAMRSDMSNAIKKIELHKIDNGGVYPTTTFSSSVDISLSKEVYLTGRNNFYYCASSNGNSFAISAITKSNKAYEYSTVSGYTDRTASGISGGTNCIAAGNTNPPTPNTAWFQAYNWNTTTNTGSWSSWVK